MVKKVLKHGNFKKGRVPVILFCLCLYFFSVISANAEDPAIKSGKSYIIKFKAGTDVSEVSAAGKLTSVFGEILKNRNNNLLKITADPSSLARYYSIDNINSLTYNELTDIQKKSEFIEPNYIFHIDKIDSPDDPVYTEQWGLSAIDAAKAWELATGKGVTIGIVDTGIDFTHEDLVGALSINTGEDINGNGKYDPWSSRDTIDGVSGDLDGIDNDGDGVADDVTGYDFVDQISSNFGDNKTHDGIPYDENGHGTMVSGVIAATGNNAKGIIGEAYNSKIIMARAFDATGNGESDDIAKSIIYLVGRGVKVINISAGENYYSRLIAEAVDYAVSCGVTVVASSGNNGWAYPHYPSDLQNVISVGNAALYNGKFTRYYTSSYGENLSLMAPGTAIYTTSVGNGYKTASGTSISAPFVTASAALLLEKNPNLTPAQIRLIFETNATPMSSTARNAKEGAGLLNIFKSLQYSEPAEISISSPREFQVFHYGADSLITITGTATAPLFDSCRITLRNINSSSDSSYKPIILKRTVKNDTLAVFGNIGRAKIYNSDGSIYEEKSGQMLISISMALKNGKSVEKSMIIEIMNENETLAVDSSSISKIYDGEKCAAMVGVKTNISSFASVDVYLNGELVKSQSDNDLYSRFHSLLLEDLISGMNYKIILKVSRRDGETIETNLDYSADSVETGIAEFKNKNYNGLNFGGFTESAGNLFGSGKNGLLVCTFDKSGSFSSSKLLSYSDGAFSLNDSDAYSYLPAAAGNIRSSRENDVMTREYGNFYLFEYKDGNLFKNKFYNDNKKSRTGTALADFDGDGVDEILSFSDTAFYVDKYIDNSLQTIAQTSGKLYSGAMPGSVVGDFDGDGNLEFAHSDRYGNVYIEEYNRNEKSLVREAYFKINAYNDYDYHYFAAGDFDGDGIKDVAFLYPVDFYTDGRYISGAVTEPKERIWKIRIYKTKGINAYREVANLTSEFANVHIGSTGSGIGTFRNGISAGNIDGKAGDELVVSVYPNVYMLKYSDEKFHLFGLQENAFSGNPLIFDFDNNGINEVLYSKIDSIPAIEYVKNSEKYTPPTDIRGWAENNKQYHIQWTKPKNSISTQIWESSIYGAFSDVLLAETADSVYTLTSWSENPGVIYFKSRYGDSTLSARSRQFLFVVKDAAAPFSVHYSNNTLTVAFSGRTAYTVEPGVFKIINSAGDTIRPFTAQFSGDYGYILTFDKQLSAGKYMLETASFFDYYSNPTQPGTLVFTVPDAADEPDSIYLTALKPRPEDYPSVELHFSQAVGESALINDNYELRPGGYLDRIERSTDSAVIIYFEATKGIGARGKEYLLTARNIKSADEKTAITTGEGNTLAFVFTPDSYDNAYLYPQPARISNDAEAWFANIPRNATVEIYTLEGELLQKLTEENGTGGIEWNLRDSKGDLLPAGVYLFKVKDQDGNTSKLKKFVTIR